MAIQKFHLEISTLRLNMDKKKNTKNAKGITKKRFHELLDKASKPVKKSEKEKP